MNLEWRFDRETKRYIKLRLGRQFSAAVPPSEELPFGHIYIPKHLLDETLTLTLNIEVGETEQIETELPV